MVTPYWLFVRRPDGPEKLAGCGLRVFPYPQFVLMLSSAAAFLLHLLGDQHTFPFMNQKQVGNFLFRCVKLLGTAEDELGYERQRQQLLNFPFSPLRSRFGGM